ncbi:hypothetical protein GCM10023310_57490 [Paenibacillus vulneris]|uniref:Uncharacterized protein n=1 Tax=Paenibacillus vulneris TaxID=1133364 RepID=A0ABW3UTQ7_9BACL|nr:MULTISPECIES: hypothetical protein [unclassified Paenibacillus]MBE1445997.1 peroxiredoxin [Paenibacillus sp. OAS669]
MKFGSFLLGGLVGAAAVVYFNNKSKSMLFSAISSKNQSLGGFADKAGASNHSDVKNQPASGSESIHAKKEAGSTHEGLARVEALINKDAEIKAAVDEILTENQQKEVYQTQ